jgi:hypothetical protein
MSNSVSAIKEEPKGLVDPSRVLEKAYISTKARGSSTACIISLTDQVSKPSSWNVIALFCFILFVSSPKIVLQSEFSVCFILYVLCVSARILCPLGFLLWTFVALFGPLVLSSYGLLLFCKKLLKGKCNNIGILWFNTFNW